MGNQQTYLITVSKQSPEDLFLTKSGKDPGAAIAP
jgi:hypothetical protein